jgi:hypothetical protein
MPDHYSLTFLIRRGDAARRPPPPPLRHSGLPFSPRRAAHTNPHVPVEAYRGAAVSGSLLMLIERLLVTPPRATSGRAGSPCGAKFRAPSPCRTRRRPERFMTPRIRAHMRARRPWPTGKPAIKEARQRPRVQKNGKQLRGIGVAEPISRLAGSNDRPENRRRLKLGKGRARHACWSGTQSDRAGPRKRSYAQIIRSPTISACRARSNSPHWCKGDHRLRGLPTRRAALADRVRSPPAACT